MSNDISVKQVFNTQGFTNTPKTPVYLVTLEDGKKDKLFIATRFEEGNNYGKFVGIYCIQDEQKIVAEYDALLKQAEKTDFQEVHFPYTRIKSIRSLVYRQK